MENKQHAGGRRLSISTRLGLWYGLTLLLLLTVFAFFCYSNYHISVHRDFDRHLTHEQRELMPFVQIDDGRPAFTSLDNLRSVAYQTDGIYGTYVRLLSPGGDELYRSPNFQGHLELPAQVLSGQQPGAREQTVSGNWEGSPTRTKYSPVTTEDGLLVGWLEVSGFEWSAHQELARLMRAMVIGTLLSVLLAIVGGFLLARRALNPVAALTEAANKITASDLSTRLPTEFGVRDELTDLAETFNGMIERLEASFRRERRFASNAAHELLTPLTTMRSGVEVSLRKQREPERYRKTLSAILVDIDAMSETVRGLLGLAQAEQLTELPSQPTDLSHLTGERVKRFLDRASAHGIDLRYIAEDGVYVRGHSTHLAEVVDNLIDNAIKYTPAGGTITVEVEGDERESRLRVEDTGIGFADRDGAQLFDRFYRADTSEVQAVPGSGLGLTVVQTIVRAYGGHIAARSAGPDRGSTFDVRFPATGRQHNSVV